MLKAGCILVAKKKKNQAASEFPVICSSIINRVIGLGMFALMAFFPLVYHNSYIDILETKYQTYWVIALLMLGVCLILGLVMAGIDLMEFKGGYTKRLFSALHPKHWRQTFRAADVGVLIFWLAAVISTFQSDYFYESFWGNEGRYSGLFLLTIYVAVYFLISRFWKPKWWYLQVFLITGMIMCLIGITDYFQLDVLDFRGAIKPEQSTIFTSTIGNINTYTAYVGIVMGVAGAMFSVEKKLWKLIWYYLCMVISIVAIIMGCSDNAYLSLGAFFCLLPLVLFGSKEGIKRCLILLATFFTIVQAIDWINQAYADMVIGLDSLFRYLTLFNGLPYLVVLLWALAAAFTIGCHVRDRAARSRGQEPGDWFEGRKSLICVWCILVLAAAAVVAFLFYDANIADHAERYEAARRYLVFDDQWGTSRGYIWKKAIQLYQEFPFMRKLWGYGPDTFGLLTTDEIRADMIMKTGLFFDTAHNAYIQYLLTVGFVGLAGYLIFLGGALWYMWRNRKRCKFLWAILCAVACYAAQALVNLDLPIVTPMMWLLLSMGMAERERPVEGQTAP